MPTDQEKDAIRDGTAFPGSGSIPPPKGGWRCFHCDEVFTSWGSARDHFGASPAAEPGCAIKVKYGDEMGLQIKLREVEQERDELQVRVTAHKLGLDDELIEETVQRFRAARRE